MLKFFQKFFFLYSLYNLKLFVSFLIARYIVHTFNHAVSDSSRIAHKLFKIFLFNVNIDTRDFSNINFNYIIF